MPKKKQVSKKKAKEITVRDETMNATVTAFVGSEEEILNSFKCFMHPDEEDKLKERILDGNTGAEFLLLEFDNSLCYTVYFKKEHINDGVITHEFFHAVCRMLNDKGILFSEQTEEVYAYVLGFMVNKFKAEYNKSLKKRGK